MNMIATHLGAGVIRVTHHICLIYLLEPHLILTKDTQEKSPPNYVSERGRVITEINPQSSPQKGLLFKSWRLNQKTIECPFLSLPQQQGSSQ